MRFNDTLQIQVVRPTQSPLFAGLWVLALIRLRLLRMRRQFGRLPARAARLLPGLLRCYPEVVARFDFRRRPLAFCRANIREGPD